MCEAGSFSGEGEGVEWEWEGVGWMYRTLRTAGGTEARVRREGPASVEVNMLMALMAADGVRGV